MKAKIIRSVLIVVALVEFYAEFIHHKDLVFFTKPLMLPLIAAYFFFSIQKQWNKIHTLMMFAFLFSWFGDVSLMLTPETITDTELMGIPKSKYFFLAGVGSFFVTQILFINAFRKTVSAANTTLSKFLYLPFVLYWITMLAIVLPPLRANAEKSVAAVPIIFYAAVLISMAATALSRYGKTNSRSFWLTFIGACIFVVSDSLIAVNFLALPVPSYYAGFSIITTYVLAEYLIAEGILQHENYGHTAN
jgi:uncharacterized membrane protein YhhN